MRSFWISLFEKAASFSWLKSLQSGFIITFPLMFIGSLAVLINQFPLKSYREFMAGLFGANWTAFGGALWNGTFAIMSVAVTFAVGVNLAVQFNDLHQTRQVSPVTTGLVCLASLFCLIVPINGGIPQVWTGVPGLFAAVLVAISSSYLFLFLSSVKRLRMQVSLDNAGGAVVHAFNSLLPGSMVIALFAILGTLFGMGMGADFHAVLHQLLVRAFENLNSEFLRGLLYTFSLQLLWFFGLHGANVLDPITHGINNAAVIINTTAWTIDSPLPYIVTKPFLESFVFIGGTGCTVSLILALFISSRYSERRQLACISSVFGVFNINELLVFGFPIILNPVMLIPFIFIPVVLCAVSYWVVLLGMVPKTSSAVAWSVPIFVNAYMVTDSVKGIMLQLMNMGLATLMYIPFVRLADSIRNRELLQAISSLFDCVNDFSPVARQKRCLNRSGSIGSLARGLAVDLEEALRKPKEKSGLYLLYQPQVAPLARGVVGVEALLRWNHPKIGNISPLIIVALAEDANIMLPLGQWILNEACATRKRWLDEGIDDLSMAVNISVHQIDHSLPVQVNQALADNNLPADQLKLEVTESVSLEAATDGPLILEQIHQAGVQIAIDDFGMGHSSLKYLRKFPVGAVKIDGSITREVVTSALSADIIASIVSLCRSRDIACIVEYVETEEQIQTLLDLNCQVFQGYYYSPPLTEMACLTFIRNFGTEQQP